MSVPMTIRVRLSAMILLLFTCVCNARGQAIYRVDTLSVSLYYQKNADSYDSLFKGNSVHLQSFVDSVALLRENSLVTIVSISGTMGASINGIAFDERFLCQRRISGLSPLLSRKLGMNSDKFKFENEGQNWKQLERCVKDAKDISHRDEVLDIIKHPMNMYFSGDTLSDGKIIRLMKLNRGQVWPELDNRFSGEMDVAVIECIYRYEDIPNWKPDQRSLKSQMPPLSGCLDSVAFYKKYLRESRFRMSVRTNLLYDLALVPNVGFDFRLFNNISLSTSWNYANWQNKPRNIIYKVYGGDVSIRYWFGWDRQRHPMTSHHIGPYGQMAVFDFAFGKNRFSAPQWLWAAGVEYGYSIPVKKGKATVDFTVGIGYSQGYYDFWHLETNSAGEGCYTWDEKHHYQYIGPTKAEISLIRLIGWPNKYKQQCLGE